MKITKGLLTKSRKKCKFIKLKKVASINLHGQMTEEVSEKIDHLEENNIVLNSDLGSCSVNTV